MGTKERLVQYRDIVSENRAPLIVLAVIVPVLAIASFFVEWRVNDAAAYDRQMRFAQTERGAILRVQLNEETGMRGYAATGDKSFLAPYDRGRARSARAFALLAKDVAALKIADAVPLVEQEREINATWLVDVAAPLIADPARSARSLKLQRLGKQRVDAFRAVDLKLLTALDAAATRADQASVDAIKLVLILNALVLFVLTLASVAFGYLQARSARVAFETRVLYENEKRIADSLQEAFLQKALPLTPGVGLHATYVPASQEAQVGGDWYDAFQLPDGRILFSIGDVAGHGLDAAVMMSRARQSIVSAAVHDDDPASVMSRANRSLVLQESRMVTAICGYLDPVTREVTYATAGHPPPVLAHANGEAAFLPHEGLPLGIVPDAVYRTFSTHADDGAMLVLYTDGVLEHKRDLIAGQARLLDAARRAVGGVDPALTIQRYVFQDSAPTDDVAILAISFERRDSASGAATPSVSALQLNRWTTGSETPSTSG